MVGLVPRKVSVSWGADQDLRLSRVRYRGEPSLYASSLVPGSLERTQACPSWSSWGKVASSDAVDPMKPELWAEGKNTESSWLLFSEGRSSRSRSRRSSGWGAWMLQGGEGEAGLPTGLRADVGSGYVGDWVGVGVGVMKLFRLNAPIPTFVSGSSWSSLMCWLDLLRRYVKGGVPC